MRRDVPEGFDLVLLLALIAASSARPEDQDGGKHNDRYDGDRADDDTSYGRRVYFRRLSSPSAEPDAAIIGTRDCKDPTT